MKISAAAMASSMGGYIPEQIYRVRCLASKFTPKNNSGQPMTTLSCEIIEPEVVEIDGKEVTTAGRKFQLFLIHNIDRTGWASQEQVMEFCNKLNVELGTDENGEPEYDTDLHKEYFHGMEWDMVLKAEEDVKRYGSDGPGHKKNDAMLDGEGNKITNGWQIRANPSDALEHGKPTKNQEIANQPY